MTVIKDDSTWLLKAVRVYEKALCPAGTVHQAWGLFYLPPLTSAHTHTHTRRLHSV